MYLNVKKIGQALGLVIGCAMVLFGIVSYAVSVTVQVQISSVLVAMFGLQVVWLIIWLGRDY